MLTEKQQIRMMTYLSKARQIAEKAVVDSDDKHLHWVIKRIGEAEEEGCKTAVMEKENAKKTD